MLPTQHAPNWKVLESYGKNWNLKKSIGKFWKELERIGKIKKYWKVMERIGKCFMLVPVRKKSIGKYWKELESFGIFFKRIFGDFPILSNTFNWYKLILSFGKTGRAGRGVKIPS